MFGTLGPVMENIKAGQLVPLGLMAEKRSTVLPEIPTMAEAGLPDFVGGTWNVLVAPAGTPPEIVERLNKAVSQGAREPDPGGATAGP